ncbi:alpha-amylase family glycosyl hydrolase [Exiguobacterium sp. s57]|uniref:alpha-amylase family glycosyl hydrolase n=1 Tax=Exiguobacterium sp. s57 TaxID=2751258 RepID=UPI001BE934EB|nr:alpha-amylase family glycosyl hydrolase [Exiguobacterium sp. s57]
MNWTVIEQHLRFVYKERADEAVEGMCALVDRFEQVSFDKTSPLTEKNVYLITYGDAIQRKGEVPLQTLHRFLNREAKGVITDVHLLPMFPYTSDDGFSVTDYRAINPDYGTWQDIVSFSHDFRLMYDFVANHLSKSSDWFKGYVAGDERYAEFFIPEDPSFDASRVVRPRTSPLIHTYGEKTAWTTFSEDQVDVNVAHIPAFLELTDVLLDYLAKGASSIRLDAIGFLWKESGTTCIHLPETHALIQVWRELVDHFKPGAQIITETNVPHQENISYFGSGNDEANQVYQFSLPPLVLYSYTTNDATKLSDWARQIKPVSETATYFNFLASHDGIGMRPTEGILDETDRQLLVDKVVHNHGRVSYKSNPDGSQTVYELNINYMDALANAGEEDTPLHTQKMLSAHSILLSVVGVPAIYYHSLFGSRNDEAAVESSGINRRINREKLDADTLHEELESDARRRNVFSGLKHMISLRGQYDAFSPYADQDVLDLDTRVFAVKRTGATSTIVAVANVSPETVELDLSGNNVFKDTTDPITLQPYGFAWIEV